MRRFPGLGFPSFRVFWAYYLQPWRQRFGSWVQAVDYLISQNMVVESLRGWTPRMESKIDIPIDPTEAIPVTVHGDLQCAMVQELMPAQQVECFAFLIPEVVFRFLGESIPFDEPSSELSRTGRVSHPAEE